MVRLAIEVLLEMIQNVAEHSYGLRSWVELRVARCRRSLRLSAMASDGLTQWGLPLYVTILTQHRVLLRFELRCFHRSNTTCGD